MRRWNRRRRLLLRFVSKGVSGTLALSKTGHNNSEMHTFKYVNENNIRLCKIVSGTCLLTKEIKFLLCRYLD